MMIPNKNNENEQKKLSISSDVHLNSKIRNSYENEHYVKKLVYSNNNNKMFKSVFAILVILAYSEANQITELNKEPVFRY